MQRYRASAASVEDYWRLFVNRRAYVLQSVTNPTAKAGGLLESRFMTSPSSDPSGLRQKGQGACGCLPVRSSAAARHAAVSGDAAKAGGLTSLSDMGEANITPQWAKEF
jgi:hypothetical protein